MSMLDFDAILAPISSEAPQGQDPRQDVSPASAYYQLKDVRNQARAAERNALIEDEPLQSCAALWRPIVERVPEVLANEGKDLELVAWLIEALARYQGFAGLAEGFTLAQQLIEAHWDGLYPLPDEDGQETRVAPLIGLNGYDNEGALLMPISTIALTAGSSSGPFALWEYQQAQELERLDDAKKAQRLKAGAVEMSAITTAARETSTEQFQQLHDQLLAAMAAYQQLVACMDQAVGSPIPSSRISKRLEECLACVRHLAGDRIKVPKPAVEEVADISLSGEGAEPLPGTAAAAPNGVLQLQQREQAIQTLVQVSEFFRKTEPHSPMSYAIDQVVRWSELSLPELLQELIADQDARKGFFRLTGISSDNP
ncbi:type VI secretion system protein TssA [Pokkaliibacter plantistimulans]|uniref:Type VI secretion system protein TssA n=1 Tax=Proteobacteria bacterium 228 TaxID=2083153 RepID=A0A2S5KNQ6_9PROT|nr:type VI secretion system protein TssA [Pokkaliibacter plantistimulans]PPC76265.1 type VI secretion system protein TssA [Pokkaliibacter plantistimulans]